MSCCAFIFVFISTARHAVGLNVCLMLCFWYGVLLVYVYLYFYSLACHAVGLYLHILTVSAWRAVSLCFILQFQHGVLLVYIYVYVYSFSVACCWFSRISQSVRSSSIIGHADPCVVSSSG